MAVKQFTFTTGPTNVPDVGSLSYNSCTFSPLFTSTLSGKAVEDTAGRTVKLMEYTLTVDGYVTDITAGSVAAAVALLTAQAAPLVYRGRGFDLSVNAAGQATFNGMARDVAWGPVPELYEFQPLGGGLSAKVRWGVTVRLVNAPVPAGKPGAAKPQPKLLEFNCETTVTYGEDYYSNLSVSGTMEIPLTRVVQGSRTLTQTVDDARSQLDSRIFNGIDLSRFRVVRREYNISRDKRTMNFSVAVEEKPYMDNPPWCSNARGTFSFRPAKAGMGLCLWLCTLRATYIVSKNQTRRAAWWAFLALLRLRMLASELDGPITEEEKDQNPKGNPIGRKIFGDWLVDAAKAYPGPLWFLQMKQLKEPNKAQRRAFLIDFSGEEGVYQDSKTTTFSATWQLVTQFSNILVHSGLWKKVPEKDAQGNNVWAMSMKDVSGSVSWLPNKLDPALDVIVDFGGG